MSAEILSPSAQFDPSQQGWVVPAEIQTHETAQTNIDQRVEQALEASLFRRSPEQAAGIKSYFEMHYAMANLVAGVIEGDLPQDEAGKAARQADLTTVITDSMMPRQTVDRTTQSIVTYGRPGANYAQLALPVLANLSLARLADPDNKQLQRAELMAAKRANELLFVEASVAVTTLSVEDKQLVIDNHHKLQAKIKAAGLILEDGTILDLGYAPGTERYRDNVEGKPLGNIERATDLFWDDSRFGGQLLFHNTANFNELYSANELLPRRMQVAATGSFNTPNAMYLDGRYHSPTPHWSENFDDWNYRNGKTAGTIAVPLAEIIKSAPYARDSHYATLTLKPEALEGIIPRIPINDGLANIGSGASDGQGKFGIDRTFYRSPHDVAPDAPLDQAPDGYAIPLRDTSTWVQLGDEVAKSELTYGVGQNLPQQLVIPVADRFSGSSDLVVIKKHNSERQRVLAEAIKALQNESIAKYGPKIVVPVRSGVIDFTVADDGKPNGKPYAEFSRVSIAS